MSALQKEETESIIDSIRQQEICLEKIIAILNGRKILLTFSQIDQESNWSVTLYQRKKNASMGVGSGQGNSCLAALAAALSDSMRVRNYEVPPRLDSSWLRIATSKNKEKIKLEDL